MDAVIAQWQKVKENIVKACNDAKRRADDVQLIAVSKTFGVEDIHPLLEAGQRVFGENRVQEAESKWPQLREEFPDLKLHLIGPLQSNKTKEAVQLFDVIETIDREKIAKFLQEEMLKQNRKLPCYVQVNIGEEPQKAGIAPNEAVEFVKHCQNGHHLDIVGLMCIPPVGENPGPYFALLAKLAKEAEVKKLSMGMSADYETAIAFGATSVRVGSAIFGHRPPVTHQ
ncbi:MULTISPECIES: YggS family pyridoxal phosphate-dependent enzyme [Bartonella]|uniref:YggS family pyridoxal phosphate-dependent enzyme n=1 Tax=Bartonella TaxID=773 RepID=UPI0018DC4ABB|nr:MULTISPECIES: YggS family pyridoxal phosphate-dependent enzyme [Bartonella]MBH9995641.1 YggS family pyridoxal phosphate-dependent enzyme [Bartonella sp. P0291]MBH9996015.1 YggS family pyridoxal phosphate-dependent enzyme [Bartonella sp. M0192]MBH9998175.1 YggS family pyridoxal phosphate-dependent enzyme [Bartonella sp. M0191]MBI0008316.1 YggS family pyridoxal phosphate-dependent enzyme [Bartonella sp. M0193]MBI0009466.1 YggS family pyridoxal phosphate-dependent enzyme [Bartonella sp. M0176]